MEKQTDRQTTRQTDRQTKGEEGRQREYLVNAGGSEEAVRLTITTIGP